MADFFLNRLNFNPQVQTTQGTQNKKAVVPNDPPLFAGSPGVDTFTSSRNVVLGDVPAFDTAGAVNNVFNTPIDQLKGQLNQTTLLGLGYF
jgi:hypothetical protein